MQVYCCLPSIYMAHPNVPANRQTRWSSGRSGPGLKMSALCVCLACITHWICLYSRFSHTCLYFSGCACLLHGSFILAHCLGQRIQPHGMGPTCVCGPVWGQPVIRKLIMHPDLCGFEFVEKWVFWPFITWAIGSALRDTKQCKALAGSAYSSSPRPLPRCCSTAARHSGVRLPTPRPLK